MLCVVVVVVVVVNTSLYRYLLEGTHGVRDEPRAFEILEELRRTDGEKMSSVLFTLASMYDKGQGVPVNGRTAVRYYTQAMQRGHTGAMCNLGYKVCPSRTYNFLTTQHNAAK